MSQSGCATLHRLCWAGFSALIMVMGASPVLAEDVPFTERVISTTAEGAMCVYATDLDGDDDIDVLSASYDDDKIAWYESDGGTPPTFTKRVISAAAAGATCVYATDVDGDDDIDVLSASREDDKIAWYESDGGTPPTFAERTISTTADGAVCVYAADVDGDGDTDVLSASVFGDEFAWYESDGGSPPGFTKRTISNAVGAWCVHPTDVDGDGDTDVLAASLYGDKVAWYESDGGSPPTFTERVISTTADGATCVYATDVDGDGDTDVLSASSYDDKISWYESDGATLPTFTEHVISSAVDGAACVHAADVDGDGDTDVLAAAYEGDKLSWFENDGGSPPTFTERVLSTVDDGVFSVYALDVDGDGDTDVLSASFDGDTVTWYEQRKKGKRGGPCSLGVGAGNLAFFWTACLVWLIGLKARGPLRRG